MIGTHFKRTCALNIRSTRLLQALSLSTVTLLTLATVLILTVLALMPVVVLALGEQNEGQRDFVLAPQGKYMNCSTIAGRTGMQPMPRYLTKLQVNGETAHARLMDFRLEREQHLGYVGGDEPENHRFVYPSSKFGLTVGQEVEIELQDLEIFDAIRTAIVEGRVDVGARMKIIK